MRILSLKQLAPYGVAVLSVGLATEPLLGESAPLLLFAITILTSWFGGFWPGLLTIILLLLPLLAIDDFFFAPKYSDSRLDQIRAVSFGIFGELPSLIFARLRGSAKAERETRERFRLLVEGVKDYAIFMLDAQGRVVSWNPGAERIKGYQANEIIGRDFSVFYTQEDIESGAPQRVLEIAAAEGRYDVSGWQVRRDGSRFWASGVIAAVHDDRGRLRGFTVIARDVTERKMMEEKFRFLDDLNQALRPLADPEEIMAAAARMLGEYLGVNRCAYAEVEATEKYLEITSEYTRGEIPGVVGRFSVDDLGSEALRLMRANRPYVVDDIEAEASARIDLSMYLQAGVRALMCAPLSKNGRYVARLAVSQKTPRRWEPWEIELVKKVADRCWESVERARAARNLRESEERYRAFIANSSEAIWRFELEQPIPVNLPEDEQIDMLYRFGYLAECNDAMARMYGYETADQIVGARLGDLLQRSDPWNITQIRALRRSGFNLTDSESHEVDRYGNTKYFLKNLIGIVENGAIVHTWGTQRDITERKEAEEELRASEERYRLLTEISPDGVIIADVDGTIHLANQSMQRMLGVTPEQVIGGNFCDFFPPRCVGKYRDCLTDLMACTLPESRVEIAFRRDDGRILPVEISAVRFDWKGRQFAQFIIHDISQRKQAEAERERLLKEIEAERNRLRQILEQMPIGVYIAEAPSGRPIFCNHEAESLLGHPLLASDDYRGYAQYGALREDGSPYRAEDYPICRALISGEVIKGEEMRYRRGDGTETILSVDSAPISDPEGRRVSAVATFIDIAERKQAEEALRKSEERFAKAFRASPEALVIARLSDAVLLEVNDSFVSLSGYDRDELIGKSTIDLGIYVDPTDRQRMLAIMKERNCVRDFEFAVRRKSGETRVVRFSAEPLEIYGEHCWLAVSRDITERQRAEEALRESEERFSKAFRASPYGLAITRQSDGVILEVNDSWLQLFGYESDEVIGKSWTYFAFAVDPADSRRARAIVEEQGYLREFEMAANRKSRETIVIRLSIEPIELRGERCMVTIVSDITLRKRAEEALRESEERFAKAFRASPDGIVILRVSDGVILEVNDSWCSLFGYACGEVVGKSWTQFDFMVDPGERLRAQAILEEQGYGRDFEMAVKRRSGEARLVMFSAELLQLRGEDCLLLIVRDITERKRAEEARRESEEQARRQLAHVEAIYATAPVGLCFVDTDLTFLSINKRLGEIDGKSVEEHTGRTVREVLPEAADTLEPVLRRVIETGEPALNIEQSVATAREPGVARHFISSYYPIKNGGGQALGVNVVVMDITRRKKIEEELEHLLREEKAAREEAEAANRMKDEFLATISHELRTPLTSILGWARMLTGGRLTTPQARHALDVIAQSAQSQTQLIEDILDTSRIISGRFKLDAQPVAIEHVFHTAVDVIRPSAEAKGIVLSEVVEAPDGVVLGDDNRLRQAVWNLLSNAVKFTSEGGRIEARLGRAEGQIEITVKDTGIGIDPKFLPHVFDRFRQADASSTREYGGLGIGLAIVRHIVETHGGSVLASSPGKGQGATFKIRLPLISASRLARPEGPRPEAPPTTKERKILENSGRLDGVRVLLVEDNLDTLDMLKFIFDESGAEVITAASVDEALEALDRFRPDALISDIAMPDRDGYDLIREVRSREPERGGKIPAVAVTAYARAEDRVRVLAAGFQMHIAKPIAPGELIAVVASLTGRIHYGSIGVSGISASSGH